MNRFRAPSSQAQRPRTRTRRDGGFTLVELSIAFTVILFGVTAGFPALDSSLRKMRVENYLSQLSVEMAKARQEAVLRGASVVIEPLAEDGALVVWVNVDGDDDVNFQPVPGATRRTSDYELTRIHPEDSTEITFTSPAGLGEAVRGLTRIGSGQRAIVFEPDGTVRNLGSVRLGDPFGNYFELRVGPAATGKVTLLKYRENPPWGDAAGFFPRGTEASTGRPMWEWSHTTGS